MTRKNSETKEKKWWVGLLFAVIVAVVLGVLIYLLILDANREQEQAMARNRIKKGVTASVAQESAILKTLGINPEKTFSMSTKAKYIKVQDEAHTFALRGSDRDMWKEEFLMRATHEPKTNERLFQAASKLPRNSIVIDCGGHVGDTGLRLALKLKNTGRSDIIVLEIEPDKSKCAWIHEQAKRMGIRNQVHIVNAALSDKPGSGTLSKHGTNPGAWTMRVFDDDSGDIPFMRLDAIVTRIDLIHLDVEGFEELALKGGIGLIKEHKPYIVLEVPAKSDSEKALSLRRFLEQEIHYKMDGKKMLRDEAWYHPSKPEYKCT